jgi:hypothetical protein
MNNWPGQDTPIAVNSPLNHMALLNDVAKGEPRDGYALEEVTLKVRQNSHSQLASPNTIEQHISLHDADLWTKKKPENTKKVFKGRQRTTKFFKWLMIDMFGDGISFNVDGEDGVKTTLGCLCTALAICMVTSISFWYVTTWATRSNIYWNGFNNR